MAAHLLLQIVCTMTTLFYDYAETYIEACDGLPHHRLCWRLTRPERLKHGKLIQMNMLKHFNYFIQNTYFLKINADVPDTLKLKELSKT